jgi:hypothetical protein
MVAKRERALGCGVSFLGQIVPALMVLHMYGLSPTQHLHCYAFSPVPTQSCPHRRNSSYSEYYPMQQHSPFFATTGSATALLAAKKNKKKKPTTNTICVNRVASRNYEIIDTMEAGISLLGTEVKSIRDGKMNIRDGYIRPTKNGRSCVLYNVVRACFGPFLTAVG